MVEHPNIVKLIEVIETNTYIGVIMEYASGMTCHLTYFLSLVYNTNTHHAITGGELFEHILARKYLKEPEARHFFGQLLAGMLIAAVF